MDIFSREENASGLEFFLDRGEIPFQSPNANNTGSKEKNYPTKYFMDRYTFFSWNNAMMYT